MLTREELLRGARRLASRANPRIRAWASLAERRARDELGLTLAEGAKLAAEALAAWPGGHFHPVALLVSDSGAGREAAGELFARAGELGLERFSLTDECFAGISSLKNPDGLALLLSFASGTEESVPPWILPESRWLVAAGVQDPGNAGALARSALAAGFSGCLYLDGADPRAPKFLRGSMGAAFRLPCLSQPLRDFVAAGTRFAGRVSLIQATSRAAGGEDYRRMAYQPPFLVLVGGERGMPPELAALATQSVHIPLAGGVESLNLAVAAGIILFEANRRFSRGDFRDA
ncbi:MAG: RNA methyltransferase [Planctomycetota bacterium]|nr:RNA methyltransferase [Planctomycetota bacterium]